MRHLRPQWHLLTTTVQAALMAGAAALLAVPQVVADVEVPEADASTPSLTLAAQAEQPLLQLRTLTTPAAPAAMDGAVVSTDNPYNEFALGPGDGLKVTVWGYPELSETIVVLPDGTVSYPLIGTMQAKGLTCQAFAQSLTAALEPHLTAPRVSVVLSDMRSRSFSVLGEVTKAGTYPLWNDRMSILEGIAQAGGMTGTAVPTGVRVFRREGEGPEDTAMVNVTALLNDPQRGPLPVVQAGDVIYVPGQASLRKICVLGEVKQPGAYPFTTEMTIIDALTAAGWVPRSAVMSSVMIARRQRDGQTAFFRIDAKRAVRERDWSQHVALQPGDIIFVPKNFIAQVGDFVTYFSSKVEPAAKAYLGVYDARNPADILIAR